MTLHLYSSSVFFSKELAHREVSKKTKVYLLYSIEAEVFCKKGCLRNFVKFIGKHLCQSFFFLKKTGNPVNFAKTSKNTFSTEHVRTTASDSRNLETTSFFI